MPRVADSLIEAVTASGAVALIRTVSSYREVLMRTSPPSSPKAMPSRARRMLLALVALLTLATLYITRSQDQKSLSSGQVTDAADGALFSTLQQRGEYRAPVGSVVGSVRSPEGAPLPGASVCVARWNVQTVTAPASCLVTDAEGLFEFIGLGAGGYTVSASLEGYGAVSADQGRPVFLEAKPERPARLDIVLPHDGVKLSGVVRDATGGDVSGAVVRVSVFEPTLRLETTSGEDGSFTFWVPQGHTVLSAYAEGYSQVELARAAPSSDVELVLTPESVLLGHVVSAKDGKPVADVTVSASPISNPYLQGAASTESEEGGEFTLSGLQPGTYVMRARSAKWVGHYPQPVELELGSTNRGIMIAVHPAVRISGRVLFAASNEPCRTGTLMLGPWPDPMVAHGPEPELPIQAGPAPEGDVDAQTVAIEADGTVTFDGMSPGRYHAVVRCMDAFLTDGPHTLDVASEDLSELTWKVSPSGAISVHTVDESNTSIGGVTVTLKHETPGAPGRNAVTAATTDPNGEFTFRGLLPGSYEVRANGGKPDDVVVADLKSGETSKAVRLKLPGSGYILARVRATGAGGVDGLQVEALADAAPSQGEEGASASTAPQGTTRPLGEGSYRIGPLGAGQYTVVVRDGVNEPVKKLGVRVGSGRSTEVNLELSRGGSIGGHVVDESGAPVANAWVTASTASDAAGARAKGEPVLTDLEGAFTLQRLNEKGSYLVRAQQVGGGVAVKRDVRAGQEIELKVPSPLVLKGSVLDPKGQSVSGASVRVRHEETGSVKSQRVDENGSFVIRGVTPGALELFAFAPTGERAQVNLNLATGSSEPLRVVLHEPEATPAAEPARATP